MDPTVLARLSPAEVRELLPAFVCARVLAEPEVVEGLQRSVAEVVVGISDVELRTALASYAASGEGYRVFEADPVARRVSRQHLLELAAGSSVEGLAHLDAVAGQPQVWICNHLSYVDTQVLDGLLAATGRAALADEVLVVAGPKVYTDAYRRFATLGLNTLKTPQSAAVATEGGDLGPRDIARLALQNQAQAEAWRLERGPVLIYPEGSRSPDGRLQSFLRGVQRWVRRPAELVVVPVGHFGAERLFARDERMRPQPVSLRFGPAFRVSEAGSGRFAVLERAFAEVRRLLPESNAPASGTEAVR